ncbi:MAG: hypothetical protein KKE73_08580 [Proteobacteria bacterium]|nr:hypothetical protein [Pseudomonadota bacterium]
MPESSKDHTNASNVTNAPRGPNAFDARGCVSGKGEFDLCAWRDEELRAEILGEVENERRAMLALDTGQDKERGDRKKGKQGGRVPGKDQDGLDTPTGTGRGADTGQGREDTPTGTGRGTDTGQGREGTPTGTGRGADTGQGYKDKKKNKQQDAPGKENWAPSAKELQAAINRSDLGLAELYMAKVRDRICCELDVTKKADGQKSDHWMIFDGIRWRPDEYRDAQRQVMDLALPFEREAIRRRKGIQERIRDGLKPGSPEHKDLVAAVKPYSSRADDLRRLPVVRKILQTAVAGRGTLGVTSEIWDRHPTLLACANGVIDLETMRLHPGRPEQYIRQASPIEYLGPHLEAPFFEESLWRMMCYDPDLVDYLDRVLGYMVTGLLSHKQLWAAYGPTHDNGKSSWCETIAWVMGDMAETVPVSLLTEMRKGGGPDPELMKLMGLRLAIFSEAEQGSKFNVSTIKSLTGGDTMSARGLFADLVDFHNTAKILLHTNYMPECKGNDPAFYRRLRLIPFRAKFTRDRSLLDPAKHIYQAGNMKDVERKYRAEGPGILAYLVRCAHRYLREEDLAAPAGVMAETEEYTAEQDLVGEWIENCVNHPADNFEQSKALYESFKFWCVTEKSIPVKMVQSQRKWGTDMKTRFRSRRTNIVEYHGLRLKEDWRRTLGERQDDEARD